MGKKQVPAIRFQGFTDAWEQRKLGELGSLKNGMNFSKEAMGIGFPFVNLQNIFGNNVIDVSNLGKAMASDSQLKDYNLLTGDVLFVRSSVKLEGVGEAALVPQTLDNTTYSGFIIRFRDEYGLDNNFKRFVFGIESVRNQIMSQATNSANKNISQSVLENLELAIPSKSEQQKIGAYFSNLDHLITLHQRKYEKLLKMKKSMLEKMFPRDGADVPEIRFDGFTDAWEQRKFIDIATRESSVCTSAVDILSVEYEDVVSEEGRLNKDIRSKETVKSGITFDGSQVLYGKLRPYLHNWLNPDFKGIAVGDWWVLKPINMDKNFLYRLIQTQQFDNIANQSSGSKMPRADWNLISNSEFMVPPSKEEQSKIGRYFDSLDRLITLHQRKLEKLKNIKKSLLEKMFV